MNSTEPVSGQLHPLNGCVLVELQQSSKNFNVKETKYQTRTEGIVVAEPEQISGTDATPNIIARVLMGKRVHFEEFKEGARIKRDGKIFSFIKIEDIRGYESV
jgi:co-chaperonin GroES (HSP10)